jgi:hypothetical protein
MSDIAQALGLSIDPSRASSYAMPRKLTNWPVGLAAKRRAWRASKGGCFGNERAIALMSNEQPAPSER